MAILTPPPTPPKRRGVSLYFQLSEAIKDRIHSGQYKPGDPLPTEERFCEIFDASRITVREALRILSDDGLVIRLPGKGTYVQKPPWGAYLSAASLEDLIYGGIQTETKRKHLQRKSFPADSRIADLLKVPVNTLVMEIKNALYLGDEPIAHLSVTLPATLGSRIPEERLAEKPIILLLSEICTLQVTEVDQWITASGAEKEIAEILNIKIGHPVLVVQRVLYDLAGRPIQLSIVRHRSDRYRQHVHMVRGAVTFASRARQSI